MANEVVFKPSPTQEQFLAAVFSGDYRYILFGGAIRGGKTMAVLGALIMLCKMYPGSRHVVVRDSLMNLKLTTIPSFLKLCPTSFIKGFNQDTMTVTMSNGSQIVFFGEQYATDPELLRFRGLECNTITLEESNEMSEQTLYKCMERAGTFIPAKGEKPKPLIMLTCNPSNGWVKRLFWDRYTNGTLPADWLYIPSKITDNPFIMEDTAYVEGLKNMPSFEYNRFVLGDWLTQEKTGSEFYKCWDSDKHTADLAYDPTLPMYISVDDNVSPYLPMGIYQVKCIVEDGKTINEVRMIDEIAMVTPRNNVENLCEEFRDRYPADKHKATVLLFGDATALKNSTVLENGSNFFLLIMGYLKDYKITNRVSKANEGVSMRGSWINAVFEKQNGNIRFLADKRCKHFINDMLQVKQNPDGSKLKLMTTDPKTKIRSQSVSHFSDINDYLLTGAFPGEFERYKKGGVSYRITTGKNPTPSKNHYPGADVSGSRWRY